MIRWVKNWVPATTADELCQRSCGTCSLRRDLCPSPSVENPFRDDLVLIGQVNLRGRDGKSGNVQFGRPIGYGRIFCSFESFDESVSG